MKAFAEKHIGKHGTAAAWRRLLDSSGRLATERSPGALGSRAGRKGCARRRRFHPGWGGNLESNTEPALYFPFLQMKMN